MERKLRIHNYTGSTYIYNALFFSCFISDDRVRYGIFLAPLFAVLIFNLIIFIIVTKVLITHKRKQMERTKEDNKKVVIGTVKTMISIVSIMVIFGLSWIFGALSISEAAVVFQWFFVILSTTQGFVIFIFFCVVAKDARKEWKKLLRCYRHRVQTTSSRVYSPSVSKTKISSLTNSARSRNNSCVGVGTSEKPDLESSVTKLEMKGFTDSVESFGNNSFTESAREEPRVSDSDSQLSPIQKQSRLDSIAEQSEIKLED